MGITAFELPTSDELLYGKRALKIATCCTNVKDYFSGIGVIAIAATNPLLILRSLLLTPGFLLSSDSYFQVPAEYVFECN